MDQRSLSDDEAVERLFISILDALAATGRFSHPDTPTSFVVYAHDVDVDVDSSLQGVSSASEPAHSQVVKKFIHWLHRLRTRTYSDQYPLGTFEHEGRTSGDAACRDILENQLCLLPRRTGDAATFDPTRTDRVDVVVVCGSPRLRSYCQHPFANTYINAVKRIYHEFGAGSDVELRQQLQQQVVTPAMGQPGFHHALTEIAFLELRHEHNREAHGIVLVNLEEGLLDYFIFTQPTSLQLQISSSMSSPGELQSRFFKLLRVICTTAHTVICKYEEAYTSAVAELRKRGDDMTLKSLDNLSEMFISRARRDLALHENEELRQIFQKRKLATLGAAAFANSEERRNKVVGKLPTIPYKDRKNRNPERLAGTCRWFTGHEKFRKWLDTESAGILWVTAYPGCGKSVLLRHLVDTVLVAPNSAICYFFFKDDFDDQKSVVSALRCLLHQVFMQRPELLDDSIVQKFEQDEQLMSSASGLWDLLEMTTRKITDGNVIVVVDALDECYPEDRRTFIGQLVTWSENARTTRLKILVSSRLYNDISQGFRRVGSEIHLAGESDKELAQISDEIALVIMHKIRDAAAHLYLDKEQQSVLHRELMKYKHKTYLWAYLVQAELENICETDTDSLYAAIENLPQSVDAAYAKILDRSGQRDKVLRMLSIVVAAAEPLSLLQLAQAWSVSTEAKVQIMSVKQMHRTLNVLCGLFVIVVEGRVYLLHQTAREFLLAKAVSFGASGHGDKNNPWRGSVVLGEANLLMARTCLRYVGLHGSPCWIFLRPMQRASVASREPISGCRCTRPYFRDDCTCFVQYAISQWADHFLGSQDAGGEKLVQEAANFTAQLSATYLEDGVPALSIASMLGLTPVVELLLESATAELDHVDGTGRTALVWPVEKRHADVVRVLLNGGSDCNSPQKWPVLHEAAESGQYAMNEMLLASGAGVNLVAPDGRTALHMAVRRGDTGIGALLLANGADPAMVNSEGMTPLMYCCSDDLQEVGNVEMMELLLGTSDTHLDMQDYYGHSALSYACRSGFESAVQLLLEHGAQVHDMCLLNARTDRIAEMLLEAGADINAVGPFGQTALTLATARREKALVGKLLEKGAYVNHTDVDGLTALYQAAHRGYADIVEILLHHGANPCLVQNTGEEMAQDARQGSADEAEDDFELTFRVYRLDRGGIPLTIAACFGHKQVVAILLEHDKRVDATGPDGMTALYKAARQGHADIVQFLVGKGANVNQPAPDGITPLIAASRLYSEELVQVLLSNKADIGLVDDGGRTALDQAAFYGRTGIIKLLLSLTHDVAHVRSALSQVAEKRQDLKELMSQRIEELAQLEA